MRYNKLNLVQRLSAVLGMSLLLAIPVQAASKKDPDREAIRRMQLQMRQIQEEKSALELDKTGLGKELDAMKTQSGALSASAASAHRKHAALEKETEKLRQDQTKLTEENTRLKKELLGSYSAERDTRNSLQQETSLKQRLEQNLSARDKALAVCETNNTTLYQYHVELVNLAQKRGSLDVLLESEPLFGFKRVKIESLLEGYRDKLDEQKIHSNAFPQAQAQ